MINQKLTLTNPKVSPTNYKLMGWQKRAKGEATSVQQLQGRRTRALPSNLPKHSPN